MKLRRKIQSVLCEEEREIKNRYESYLKTLRLNRKATVNSYFEELQDRIFVMA